jgi:hypothetical protein
MTIAATRLAEDHTAQTLREAVVRPSSWNEADLSFDVVWSTGAAVTRFDWYDGEFYDETLSLEPGAVRLDRLQLGGPVLLDHIASTDTLAGSIVPGSVRIERGQGIARARLADTPALAEVVSKVRDGHLRSVSIGYLVHEYHLTVGRNGARDAMHAVDWEPLEISLTPVPADAGATVRMRSDSMTKITTRTEDRPNSELDDPSPYTGTPKHDRKVSIDAILRACSRAKLSRSFEQSLIERNEAEPMSEAALFDAIVGELATKRNSVPVDARIDSLGADRAPTRKLFAEALFARMSGKPAPAAAQEYVGASLVDMARALLEERGERVRWARASSVIDAALRGGMHATSDFADLLTDASQRFLLEMFTDAGSPLRVIGRKRTLPDFRAMHGLRAEGDLNLLLTEEGGEFKRGSFETSKNSIQLNTYGRIFGLSRQAIVNDDLGAFLDMQRVWARALSELEGSSLTALISGTGGTLAEDGKALYHVDHGNVAATGGAITVETLSAAREAMRTQKNLDGTTVVNAAPKYLVVGPAKETEAEQVLAALSPATTANANPFSGKLELVVDPRQTGNSWRLFADPSQFPVVEYANLEGQEGLYTDTRSGFDVDGVEFKARIDHGTALMGYRGTYMNPGD